MENVVLIFFLIIIFWLIFKSIKQFRQAYYFRKNGVLAEGEIEHITVETDSDDNETYRLIVKFSTFDGLLIKKVVIKTEDAYKVGLKVSVLYDKNAPINFLVNDPEADENIDAGIGLLLMAIGFLISLLFVLQEAKK
jgi:hypothetical protein